MKTMTKILLTISIILGALTTVAVLTINSIDRTESGVLINFNDGSGYYIEIANKEKIQPTFQVTNIFYESTNNFYLSEGEIGGEFSDGSWISANPLTNEYTFQPYELGDWSFDFDNLQDLVNCVQTYLYNKNL